MSDQSDLRSKGSHRGYNRGQGFFTTFSSESRANGSSAFEEVTSDSKTIPDTIYILDNNMTNSDDHFNLESGTKLQDTATLTTVSLSKTGQSFMENDDDGQRIQSNSVADDIAEIQNDIAEIKNAIKTLTVAVKELSSNLTRDRHITRPFTDPFYHKLHVQQYPVLESGVAPTWSLMKIKETINGEEIEKGIAISSAHHLKCLTKKEDSNLFFIALPEALYEVGVEAALFDDKYHPDLEYKAPVGVLIVILKQLPTINSRRVDLNKLEVYPASSIAYDESWRFMDVVGKSRRHFVIGRGVEKVDIPPGTYYDFTSFCREKGDSGTLMYVTTETDEKQLVGIYEGSKKSQDYNTRGYVTPALGWTELKKTDAVDVQYVKRTWPKVDRSWDVKKFGKGIVVEVQKRMPPSSSKEVQNLKPAPTYDPALTPSSPCQYLMESTDGESEENCFVSMLDWIRRLFSIKKQE